MAEFRSFTSQHLIVVGVCVAVMVAVPLWARALRKKRPEGDRPLRLSIAISTIGWQIWINLWWLQSDVGENTLPLHVCDIAAIASGFTLLSPIRRFRPLTTLMYFWGIALSTQAFVTPVLEQGMASPVFWSFWVGHVQIVGIALYHVVVLGYRPTLRDVRTILLINLGYLAAALSYNIAFDANYGYVGNSRPDKPTLVDALGPWPLRVVWITLIGSAACVASWAPWGLVRAIKTDGES